MQKHSANSGRCNLFYKCEHHKDIKQNSMLIRAKTAEHESLVPFFFFFLEPEHNDLLLLAGKFLDNQRLPT